VEDGGNVAESLLPADPRIRYIKLQHAYTIGGKRNLACELARGSVIAHWDDDDWSFPGRLAEQVAILRDRPAIQVTGYHSMLFQDEKGSRWLYRGSPNYALGTSLCYRRTWWESHRFPDLQVGEDNDFVAKARPFLYSVNAEHRMIASIHSGNTSAKRAGSNWEPVQCA
jgi:glycosyltransferase involved in cell wall biosynthesis